MQTFNHAPVLDFLIERIGVKNDAALSRALKTTPPAISKVRHGRNQFGPSMILAAHELHDIPVREIRAAMGE